MDDDVDLGAELLDGEGAVECCLVDVVAGKQGGGLVSCRALKARLEICDQRGQRGAGAKGLDRGERPLDVGMLFPQSHSRRRSKLPSTSVNDGKSPGNSSSHCLA